MNDRDLSSDLSQSKEDYLGDIYRLQTESGVVNTSHLAHRLGVAAPSATAMFKRLAQEGFVEYRPYSGVSLTSAGERAALQVVRRHRVIERFLTDILGMPWERVDELAHRMEHALPEDVVAAIENLLGSPEACPHGYPIPSVEGVARSVSYTELDDLATGETAIVRQVNEANPALLRYLREEDLVPGRRVTVEAVNPIDGTTLIAFGGRTLVIGPRITQAIKVERVDEDARGPGDE